MAANILKSLTKIKIIKNKKKINKISYCKNLNNWTVCYVVGLSSLSMVKKFLFFFLSQKGERGCAFAVFFAPFQRREFWTT